MSCEDRWGVKGKPWLGIRCSCSQGCRARHARGGARAACMRVDCTHTPRVCCQQHTSNPHAHASACPVLPADDCATREPWCVHCSVWRVAVSPGATQLMRMSCAAYVAAALRASPAGNPQPIQPAAIAAFTRQQVLLISPCNKPLHGHACHMHIVRS